MQHVIQFWNSLSQDDVLVTSLADLKRLDHFEELVGQYLLALMWLLLKAISWETSWLPCVAGWPL